MLLGAVQRAVAARLKPAASRHHHPHAVTVTEMAAPLRRTAQLLRLPPQAVAVAVQIHLAARLIASEAGRRWRLQVVEPKRRVRWWPHQCGQEGSVGLA